MVLVSVDCPLEGPGDEDIADKEGGIVGPEGVVAAKKAGNPRAAMIEEVGGECRDTE